MENRIDHRYRKDYCGYCKGDCKMKPRPQDLEIRPHPHVAGLCGFCGGDCKSNLPADWKKS